MRGAVLVLLLAGCPSEAVAPSPDLAAPASDLAVDDLAATSCPATWLPAGNGFCSGAAVCRYPTDAGAYDHLFCDGTVWEAGNCPFGPGYALYFDNCTAPCFEQWHEASVTCSCRSDGKGVCCINTGGFPTCGNFDGGM